VSKFYVYEHIRSDTGAVFYVGKGSGARATVRRNRNQHWKNIVAKNNGIFSVRFVAKDLDEELALLVEVEAIDKHISTGSTLCNKTIGGEGISEYKFSAEQRLRMVGHKHSEATKLKISAANMGSRHSEESYAAMAAKKRGKPISNEHKKKLSIAFAGEKNHMWGKTHDEEAREKIRLSRINCKKVECPHCGRISDTANASRWHFENCKLKGTQNG